MPGPSAGATRGPERPAGDEGPGEAAVGKDKEVGPWAVGQWWGRVTPTAPSPSR